MKKKILGVVMVAIVAVVMVSFAGCGKSNDEGGWKYIKDNGKLIVGLDDTFAPMGFRDKDDKLVGFDIDLAKAMAKKLDVKVEFKPIDWDSKEAELKSKKIDCIWNGMSATADRQKSMALSKKYLKNRILIMSLDKNVKVKSAADLKNMKLGTQADSAALEAIQADKKYDTFKDNVKEYKTYDEAILDMKAGRIKAVAIDEVYAIYNNANKDKLYESEYNFGADYYAVGFRKGDDGLADKVNEALKSVYDDCTAAKISKKWFGKDLVILEGYDK